MTRNYIAIPILFLLCTVQLPLGLHSFIITNSSHSNSISSSNVGRVRRLSSSSATTTTTTTTTSSSSSKNPNYVLHSKLNNQNNDGTDIDNDKVISKEAQDLLDKARRIRESLKEMENQNNDNLDVSFRIDKEESDQKKRNQVIFSKFNIQPNNDDSRKCESIEYRLYLDIGREEGTWMDPRWGRSGKRIECTIDVSSLLSSSQEEGKDLSLAGEDVISNMVKDNLTGTSSPVRIIQSAPKARLRNGFDEMNTYNGGYRIDVASSSSSSNTVRFYLTVLGTDKEGSEESSTYGDINIPKGNLYFSLPCFGKDVKALSTKEGIVTVRQFGWHTGWRREESRILGIFRAVPLDKARRMDGF